MSVYNKIKKQNGEKFAQTLRKFHEGLFEIPGIDAILRHAGRDAKPLIPYLMTIMAVNDDEVEITPVTPLDPFRLLDQAGYDAFYADTLDKQNSIKHHFVEGELLCTFNSASRYQDYHIIHAVKKNVSDINRDDFKGREERQDEYGTSVISIQILKSGGVIKITNRYNHTVSGSDNTFNSNPDNIIGGLSNALKNHFNVDFTTTKSPLPDNYTIIDSQIFKYYRENNNTYYGDQAWVDNGVIHTVDKAAGDALFEGFLFCNKDKKLIKMDLSLLNSFADDFNRDYGENRGLSVDKNGNLTLDGEILIGTDKSRIITIKLPKLKTMGSNCFHVANSLTHFEAQNLETMGSNCFFIADSLTHFEAPKLENAPKYLGCLQSKSNFPHLKLNA